MKTQTKIRLLLLVFVVLLLLSGITAFPLRTEMVFLASHLYWFPEELATWIHEVDQAISQTPDTVLYGTDWLAFAHIVISLFFIPVYIEPARYKGNLVVGMIACIGVLPLAFICGPIRGIPFFHQLIDCAFGLFGIIPLYYVYRLISRSQTNISHAN